MALADVAIVALLAVVAPVVARLVPRRAAVPVVAVEILVGVLAGPHGLGWLRLDGAVDTLALLGVTFLFFLAGLEVDLHGIRGRLLARSLLAYVGGLGLALGLTLVLHLLGLLEAPVLVAVAFSATGLGLVIPILRDAGQLHTRRGRLVVAMAGVAEFSAVLVLALAFSAEGTPAGALVLLMALVALALAVSVAGKRAGAHASVASFVDRLSGGTTQLRVRLSVALVVGFAALAQAGGLEVVLGAFFAGGILNVLDGDSMADPAFRGRLDGIGYGFLIPVFFVASGARLDLSALTLWPDAVVLLPVLLLVLLVSRGLPSVLLAPGPKDIGSLGVGLMCATSLPFVVTAAQVGVTTGRIGPSTAAAMTTAGLVGVCLFPAIGVALLGRVPDTASTGSGLNASRPDDCGSAPGPHPWRVMRAVPRLADDGGDAGPTSGPGA